MREDTTTDNSSDAADRQSPTEGAQPNEHAIFQHPEPTYRALFHGIHDGLVATDLEGHILEANRAFCSMIGYNADELYHLNSLDITPPQWHHVESRIIQEVLKHAYSGIYEKEYIKKDGTTLPVEIRTCTIKGADERPPEFWSVIRDISARKHLESQILLAQKYESLGVLAGGIAHDFNNLLMGIVGNAELAIRKISPVAPVMENLQSIERAAQRMAVICSQMLAYSGKGQFSLAPIDIGELVNEMSHLLEISVSKRIVIKYKFADNTPRIKGDVSQLQQVIMNLVTNAAEAIGEKSGVISIATGAMDCDRPYLSKVWMNEQLAEGMYAYIEISDTGCGMDKETRIKIFDPFFSTKFAGRGLGLAAVMGIVRGHKGALKVYTETDKGTTIKILLPVSSAEVLHTDTPRSAPGIWQGTGTILLVDDEDTVRAVGKDMLEALGFSVITAPDGIEARELFRHAQDTIACVLLDLTMPNMDGEETFRELRQIKDGVKIILCSGYSEKEVVTRFAGKGLAGYIQKPYKLNTLERVMRAVLEEKG